MRAVTYRAFGTAAEVLNLEDLELGPPGPGEVAVDVAFSGVNPSDVKARAGARPGVTKPPFPVIVPHSDGAGVISAVGAGVAKDRIGERVWIWNGQWRRPFGTCAERIILPSEQAVTLPDAVSLEVGATLGIPGLTACHTVFSGGPVARKTLLVQGAAGTVGYLAVQLAKWGGAKVIATARGAGLERAHAAGADAVLDYASGSLPQDILATNDGAPVDRIVEVEFGANVETDAEVIAENGTICAYGSARNMSPVLPFYPLMFKAVTLEMALIYLLTPPQRATTVAYLNQALTDGALHCPIDTVFPLEQCAAAHVAVETGGRAGAVLVATAPA